MVFKPIDNSITQRVLSQKLL